MSKALVIKGADFEQNRVAVAVVHPNPIGVIDLTNYLNTYTAINGTGAVDPYKVVAPITTADSYIIPVVEGESYSINYSSGINSVVVGALPSNQLVIEDGYATNLTIVLQTGGAASVVTGATFDIPTGSKAIFICGRNSTHSSHPTVLLGLTRTA